MTSNSTSSDPWALSAKAYCENLNESMQASLDDWSSKFTSMMVAFHVYYYVIIVTGTVGNSLVIYIYGKKTQKTTAAQCVLFLGVTDLLVCSVITPLSLHEVYFNFSSYNEPICIFYEYVHHASLAISCMTLGSIALDRFIAICRPLHYTRHVHRAKYMVLVEVLVACILEIPLIFLAGLQRAEMPDGLLGCVCYWKEEYAGTHVYLVFQTLVMSLQLSLLICICVLYGFVYKEVKERERKKRQGQRVELGRESVNGARVAGHNFTLDPGVRDTDGLGIAGQASVLDDGDARKRTESNNPNVSSATTQVASKDESQQKHTSPSKANNAFISRRGQAVNVLETVQEDPKGEQETHAAEESQNTSKGSSIMHSVSDSGNGVLHHQTVDNEVSESRDVKTRSSEEPEKGDSARAIDARRALSAPLHATRVQPLERLTSLNERTANLVQARANARLRNRYKTAQMLVLVTVIFFITWIPYWSITLYAFVRPDFYKEKEAWELNAIKILRHFYLVNNATNPLIYTFVNKQFRDEIKQIFLCKKSRKR